ncbi:hypothetical protein KC316_g16371, partial [Hortaea werneckii]
TPAICIEINLAPQLSNEQLSEGMKQGTEWIRCWVFGNSIKVPWPEDGLPTTSSLHWLFANDARQLPRMLKNLSDEFKKEDPGYEARIKAVDSKIMETRFELWSEDELDEDSGCVNVQRTRPVWTGVDLKQLFEWDTIVSRGNPKEMASLTAGQIAAGTLSSASAVSIYAEAINDWGPVWKSVSEYMLAAMAASTLWGPFWQYYLQAWGEFEKSLNHPKLNFSRLTVPRHLVLKWKVLQDKKTGQVFSAEPFEWAKVSNMAIWPTKGAATFILKLGEAREIQKRKQLVEEALTKPENKVFATFSKDAADKDVYHVDMRLPDFKLKPVEATSSEEVDVWSVLPGEGETFKITVAEGQGLGNDAVFKGTLEDSLSSKRKGIVLSGKVLFAGMQRDQSFQVPEDREFLVKLKLWTTTRAGTSKAKALEILARGIKDSGGPDLAGLLFKTQAYVGNPGVLAQQISGTAGLLEKMGANLNRKAEDGSVVHNLNDEQKRAVQLMWTSKKGVVVIHGPPGTGKTRTVVAGVEGLVLAGLKVAVVAPANSQVDNAMSVWETSWSEDVEMGGNVSDYAPIDGAHGAAPVIAKRISQLKDIQGEVGLQAGDYVCGLSELDNAVQTGNRALAKKISNQLRNRLEEPVFKEACRDVRLWFSTTNSSGHRVLSKYGDVDVIVVEEAGLSSAADLAVTLASFAESAKLVVLAGDHMQQTPISTSSERNEGHKLMEVSQFSTLINDSPESIDMIQLRTQYRGHPDIYQPLSDVFYGNEKDEGGLVMAESTRALSPKQKYIQRFMRETFGAAYHGSMRCAVSVDGPDAAHEQYKEGTSICNPVEIEYIVDWILGLLSFQSKLKSDEKDLAPILPTDIGISSPYNGQCKALRQALAQSGLAQVGVQHNDIEVITAGKVQGRQFPVHIISFAKHHEKDDRDNYFVANRGQCNVQWSRAQLFQLQVGNILPWAWFARYQLDTGNHKKKFYRYIDGLAQKGEVISRGDWNAGSRGAPPKVAAFKLPPPPPGYEDRSQAGNRPVEPAPDSGLERGG